MRVATICLVSSMGLLAACSKSPNAGAGATIPSAAPPAAASPTGLLSIPHRKPGLWKINFSTDSGPGVRMSGELCIDEKTERTTSYAAGASGAKNCTQSSLRPGAGGGYVFDSTCKFARETVTAHGVVTGDFNNTYSVTVSSHMDPPIPGGSADVRTEMQAQWQGPCKPGQTPGAMSMKLAGIGKG